MIANMTGTQIKNIALTIGLITGISGVNNLTAQEKPNVLFIMVDDLGWQDVGFMGSTYYETPNIDKLASKSLVMTNSYMYPTCAPSRAALATGKHSFRTQMYSVAATERGNADESLFSRQTLTKAHTHYASLLNEAGYQLIHIGKWHLVGPYPLDETARDYPFDRHLSQPDNGDLSWVEKHKSPDVQQYYPEGMGYYKNVGGTFWGDPARGYDKGYQSKSGGYRAPFKNPFIEPKTDDEWLTDRLTDEAIGFMKNNQEKPFFVNLHFYSVHRPTVPRSDELKIKYENKKPCPVTGQYQDGRAETAAYATMVENVDRNVGRLLKWLDESGLRENTVVFFTSDNGFNHRQSFTKNLRGTKFTFYEGGLRVPALINWKGTISPQRTDEPTQCIDYFPTFLDLAGIEDYDGFTDGNSLVPMMHGNSINRTEPLFWHLASEGGNNPDRAAVTVMRKGNWKLIQRLNKPEKSELYNLQVDPKEQKNLYNIDRKKAESLVETMTKWRRDNKVPLPPASPLKY